MGQISEYLAACSELRIDEVYGFVHKICGAIELKIN